MISSYISQLRALFLPESLQGYYITAQKLVGIEIQQTAVFVTTVTALRHKKTITSCFQQDISQDDLLPLEERIVEALKKVETLIGDYDQLTLSLSNNLAIFKEVTIPFTSIDTIKLVVPFEVEPLLPFALTDAVIDAFVVHQDTAQNKATVQVAAIKRQTVESFLKLLHEAGLKPTKISVHLFEFYSIYKEIPEYHTDSTPTLCIEIGDNSQQFIALVDGELKNSRIIPRAYNSARFIQDIQFTLDTFNNSLPDSKKIERILVATSLADHKIIIDDIQEKTGIKTEEFLLYKVVHNNTIKAVNSVLLTSPFIGSVAAALDLSYTNSINFLQGDLASFDNKLLLRQLITGLVLLAVIVGALIAHTQLTQSKVKSEIELSQKEAKNKLIKELGLPEKQVKSKDLKGTIDFAQAHIAKEEEIWFALSNQNRYSFLNYLQELSRKLDPQKLGLNLALLSMKDSSDTIDLEGEVRELDLFNQELSRFDGIFKSVSPARVQEPKFHIKITLDKNYRES